MPRPVGAVAGAEAARGCWLGSKSERWHLADRAHSSHIVCRRGSSRLQYEDRSVLGSGRAGVTRCRRSPTPRRQSLDGLDNHRLYEEHPQGILAEIQTTGATENAAGLGL